MKLQSYVTKTKFHLLSDRRILSYQEFGDPLGLPVFYSHGTPGSRLEGELFHDEALTQSYRLICIDRPGFGESTYLPNRNLLDYPKDIVELADELKIDKFAMIGWSGGAIHSLACGYAIPERLLFNIILAGYTNFFEMPNALTYLRSSLDQVSVGLSKKHPLLFKLFFDLMAIGIKVAPEMSLNALVKSLNSSDKKTAANSIFKRLLCQTQKEAFREGSIGVTTDASIHYQDWGFNLSQISAPVQLLHGDEDHLVPVEFSRFNASKIPHSQLHVFSGEGHLFPANQMKTIFSIANKTVENNYFVNKQHPHAAG